MGLLSESNMSTTVSAEPIQRPPRPLAAEPGRPSLPTVLAKEYLLPAVRFVVKLGVIVLLIPVVVILACLPLSAQLLMLPALIPAESVLSDVVVRRRFFSGLPHRFLSLALGLFALAAIGLFAYLVASAFGFSTWTRNLLPMLLALWPHLL